MWTPQNLAKTESSFLIDAGKWRLTMIPWCPDWTGGKHKGWWLHAIEPVCPGSPACTTSTGSHPWLRDTWARSFQGRKHKQWVNFVPRHGLPSGFWMSCLGSGDAGKECNHALHNQTALMQWAMQKEIWRNPGTSALEEKLRVSAQSPLSYYPPWRPIACLTGTPFYTNKISSHIVNRYQTK